MFPWAVSSRSLSKTIWLVKLVVYVTGPDPFGRSGRGGWSVDVDPVEVGGFDQRVRGRSPYECL